MIFQGFIKGFSLICQRFFKGFSYVFHRFLKGFSLIFQWFLINGESGPRSRDAAGTQPGRSRDALGQRRVNGESGPRSRDATGRSRDAAGTQPGRAGATGGEEEQQDFSVPPALATPESRLALTQLRVAIAARTRNTISRFGGTDKPVSLPQPPIYVCILTCSPSPT